MSESGGRYNRSFEGLVGAVIVTVLAVVGFVVFRSVFSDPPVQDVPEIDYLQQVGFAQRDGFDTIVYPATLPAGWKATDFRPDLGSDRPRFDLNLFTDDDKFVGLRQVDADAEDLLDEAGIDDRREEDPLTTEGDVAPEWDAWSDPDGDHAYTATVGEDTVLVYGSVSAATLADLVRRLTTEPVEAGSVSPSDPSSPLSPSSPAS